MFKQSLKTTFGIDPELSFTNVIEISFGHNLEKKAKFKKSKKCFGIVPEKIFQDHAQSIY